MHTFNPSHTILRCCAAAALVGISHAFAPSITTSVTTTATANKQSLVPSSRHRVVDQHQVKSFTAIISPNGRPTFGSVCAPLKMSSTDDNGPGTPTVIAGIVGVIILLASSFVPMMMDMQAPVQSNNMGLGDAVASKSTSTVNGDKATTSMKFQDGSFESLSRANIQEKMNRVPVFYLANKDGTMDRNIYVSFEEATKAASASGTTVKVTTLDQVTFPLVMKRGRMRMAPPPPEIAQAEAALMAEGGNNGITFQLVPSTSALKAAKETEMDLADGDVPLFASDRLAFASPKGPEVPLFFEKADCVTSYERLRSGGGPSSRLPVEPTIRTTTLADELYSMEKGTRPSVKQLQFYSAEYDLIHAAELFGQ